MDSRRWRPGAEGPPRPRPTGSRRSVSQRPTTYPCPAGPRQPRGCRPRIAGDRAGGPRTRRRRPVRCGPTTCGTKAPATAASRALPPSSSTAIPDREAGQWPVGRGPGAGGARQDGPAGMVRGSERWAGRASDGQVRRMLLRSGETTAYGLWHMPGCWVTENIQPRAARTTRGACCWCELSPFTRGEGAVLPGSRWAPRRGWIASRCRLRCRLACFPGAGRGRRRTPVVRGHPQVTLRQKDMVIDALSG
jgi:hypothetical protein